MFFVSPPTCPCVSTPAQAMLNSFEMSPVCSVRITAALQPRAIMLLVPAGCKRLLGGEDRRKISP